MICFAPSGTNCLVLLHW